LTTNTECSAFAFTREETKYTTYHYSERHTQGFIAICKEYPDLYVKRRIGLLHKAHPSAEHIWRVIVNGMFVEEYPKDMIVWLDDARALSAGGMPQHSFQPVIDGTTQETAAVWNLLKVSAALQDAMLNAARVQDISPHGLFAGSTWPYPSYQLPWHLSVHFSQTFRDILLGNSAIRELSPVESLWDQGTLNYKTRDWMLEDWKREWRGKVMDRTIRSNVRRSLWDEDDLSTTPTPGLWGLCWMEK
jgi:hypothetical protein